ncbi:MAG: OmpW family outer membrane protein [Woeseiaceae bacterium]|nr:OmpW family outer membrane protein [Woeseiaceae bacterium]
MRYVKHTLAATALLAFAAGPALAYDEGTWLFRGGVGTIQPKSDNYEENLDGATVGIDVANGTSMTLTGTYMFSRNWALDVLASLPFTHDIDAVISEPGLGTASVRIGETKHLPPTVSIQYHFAPDAKFQPYFGAGINWTTFFDSKLTGEFVAFMADEGLDVDKLKLDDSLGLALQVGGDWQISDQWLLNIDVRYIDIETDTAMVGTGLDETHPDERVALDIGTVEIDPWIYSINLGYRF